MLYSKLTSICYTKIEIHIDRVKSIKSSSTNWGSGYKIEWVIDKLSQHAITLSQTRETRHAIPTCYVQASYPSMQSANQKPGKSDTLFQHAVAYTSYPSMQLANQKPGKLDMLSQHAADANHSSEKLDMQSQLTQHRHTIPACIAKINLYKRGCNSPEQQAS